MPVYVFNPEGMYAEIARQHGFVPGVAYEEAAERIGDPSLWLMNPSCVHHWPFPCGG